MGGITADNSQLCKCSPGSDGLNDTREYVEQPNEFPTLGQRVLDTTLKDMLASVKGSRYHYI